MKRMAFLKNCVKLSSNRMPDDKYLPKYSNLQKDDKMSLAATKSNYCKSMI